MLVRVDEEWIPTLEGFSGYLRPTIIATEETLGVRAPRSAKLYCVISPVGPYFPTGFKPVKVYCNTVNVRAGPGGVGEYKVGGNYAPTILPNKRAEALGFN
jgi:branched-chain amino acid aminotransferase